MTTDWTTGPRTLPCPFCDRGGARAFPTDGGGTSYAVLCRGCGAEGPPAPAVAPRLLESLAPIHFQAAYWRALRELAAGEAIRAWNERPRVETNITTRWMMGKPHHPASIALFTAIASLDFTMGDFFGFKSGGDGDNGEHLMYLLDIVFEQRER